MERSETRTPIGEDVAAVLSDAGQSVALAEGVTGGQVGALLATVPGASEFFDRSAVAYSDRAKREELDIEPDVIAEAGSASGVVAEGMARRVHNEAGTAWSVSTTGVAGPTDEPATESVGTVYVGLARDTAAGYKDTAVNVSEYEFQGPRRVIVERAARQALTNLHAAASAGASGLEFR